MSLEKVMNQLVEESLENLFKHKEDLQDSFSDQLAVLTKAILTSMYRLLNKGEPIEEPEEVALRSAERLYEKLWERHSDYTKRENSHGTNS